SSARTERLTSRYSLDPKADSPLRWDAGPSLPSASASLRPMDKNKVIDAAAKLIAKGAFDKAVKEYQRVLEMDPDDVRVLQKLAELYQKMNRKSDAADFEKVARTYSQQGFYL